MESGWIARSAGKLRATYGVFEDRNYLWYWVSTLTYYIGFFTEVLARGWLSYKLTDSAVLLGYAVLSQGIPLALLSVVGGALADRLPKRIVLIASQIALAGSSVLLWALLAFDLLHYWHVVVLGVIGGAAVGLSLPSRLAFVSEVARPESFVRAYGLYYVGANSMRVTSPAAGGALIAALGIGAAYLVIAASHLVSLFALLQVTPRPGLTQASRPGPILRDLGDTFRFAFRNPVILVLMASDLGNVFFAQPSINLMPVFAEGVFRTGAAGLGGLLAAYGLGGLAGSIATAAATPTGKTLRLLGAGMLQGVLLLVFAVVPWYTGALPLLAAAGFASAAYTTLNSTLYQLIAPAEMRGRVMSLYLMGQALQPAGMMPISAAADVFGVQAAVAAAGGVLALYMGAVAVRFPWFRRMEA